MHKSQVFFYILSAFILGVFFSSLWPASNSLVLILIISGLITIAVSYKNKFGLLAGFLILAFVVGGTRFNTVSAKGGLIFGENLIGEEVQLQGYIDSEPVIDDNLQRFVLKFSDSRILVTANAYPKYKFGDFIKVLGKLEKPQNFSDFDYVNYLKKDGIETTLFFPKIEIFQEEIRLSLREKFKLDLYKNIFILKNKFEKAVNLSIAEPNAAFINGILLGSRQNIPEDLKQSFQKTSTSHVLAISGYNIMIISWAILGLLVYFFKRRIAFWISVAVIILFVILTGASASVVRAAVMGLIFSFANGYGRLYDQKNSIILAGAAMIWINPFVLVFDIGFQLSFAAVLGLIYLYPYIDSKTYKLPKLGGIKEISLMTFSAQLAVLPLALYYFGNFSLLSLPANILILSFLPAAMLTGFLSGLAGIFFLPLGQAIGYFAWAITSYQISVVEYFASFFG